MTTYILKGQCWLVGLRNEGSRTMLLFAPFWWRLIVMSLPSSDVDEVVVCFRADKIPSPIPKLSHFSIFVMWKNIYVISSVCRLFKTLFRFSAVTGLIEFRSCHNDMNIFLIPKYCLYSPTEVTQICVLLQGWPKVSGQTLALIAQSLSANYWHFTVSKTKYKDKLTLSFVLATAQSMGK